jgi:hypothetical protein
MILPTCRRCMNGPSSSRLCPGIVDFQSLDYAAIMQSLFCWTVPSTFAATNVCLAPNININVVFVTQVLES